MLSIFIYFISAIDQVVTDNDILMSKQAWGETKRDKSVEDGSLTIAGVTYTSGLGTHATSMIRATVPSDAKYLRGGCGIDDEVTVTDSIYATIKFQILSGSEVLWSSEIMKKGDPASNFIVPIPKGCTVLFLLADQVDENFCDHGDWVNLEWVTDDSSATIKSQEGELIHHKKASEQLEDKSQEGELIHHKITVKLLEDKFADSGELIRQKITEARANPGSTIVLQKGEYHFYSTGALLMSFHTSNHDQPQYQPVGVPLVDLKDVTFDGSGSTFYFHNHIQPFLIMDSENVIVKNVKIDLWRPYVTEAHVVEVGSSTKLSINSTLFPYHVDNGQLIFDHEGFTLGTAVLLLFEKDTKRILKDSQSAGFGGAITENDDGTITIARDYTRYKLKKGDVLGLKSGERPYPAMVIYRAKDTTLDNVQICSSQGMAIISQRSENLHFIRSGAVYGKGRYVSATADATHFSNCKGTILVEDGIFEGMMDDAINVHSTSLKITEIINQTAIKIQYVHGQSVGFETFLPGEKVQFIKSSTFENDEIRNVLKVVKLSTNQLILIIDESIPSSIAVGDSVENGDYYPSVTFRNNIVRNNCARGCLFTTPKDVLVEGNYFDYTSGSVLLLAGDAANWYESGACKNVVIRNNRILNPLTSVYQFTEAIFAFTPTINNVNQQQKFYHANIKIEGNIIIGYDVPLLYSISAENIEFINNKIQYTNDYQGWNERAFQFVKVRNITIGGNIVVPDKTFTIDDVSLDKTDESEIHFK